MTDDVLLFANKEEFRDWLAHNAENAGIWLAFGKKGGPKTLTAAQALEEALCFGWIDGQMKSIDDTLYHKYFSPRRPQSQWSEKNRNLAAKLEEQGRITDAGRAKIKIAKERGTWEGPARVRPTDEQVGALAELVRGNESAYTNFMAMTPSAKRAYTGAYLDAKSDESRKKRLEELIERFTYNLNPMESLKKKKAEMQ